MSMINDALRRASSAAKTTPPPPPPAFGSAVPPVPPPPPPAGAFAPPPPMSFGAESLPPAIESEEAPKSSGNKVQVILAVALVVVVGLAVAINFWSKKVEAKTPDLSVNSGSKAILPNAAETRVHAPTNAIAKAAATLATIPTSPAPAPTAPVPTAVATPAPVQPPQPPPKFPALKLQSIFYRPSNPSVMINGKTLFVDDEIQGVTVADIQPASVTLVLSGHTNVLTLR